MSETTEAPAKSRSESLQATRAAKLEALFGGGRQYTVVDQVKLGPEDEPFVTPFGNKGRSGWFLRLVAGQPAVLNGVELPEFIVGDSVIRNVTERYGEEAIANRPVKEGRKRRASGEKAQANTAAAQQARESAERAASRLAAQVAAEKSAPQAPSPAAVAVESDDSDDDQDLAKLLEA